jgi:hypothetical protein
MSMAEQMEALSHDYVPTFHIAESIQTGPVCSPTVLSAEGDRVLEGVSIPCRSWIFSHVICLCLFPSKNSRSDECVEAVVIPAPSHSVHAKGNPLAGVSVGCLIHSLLHLFVTFSTYLPAAIPEVAMFEQASYLYD